VFQLGENTLLPLVVGTANNIDYPRSRLNTTPHPNLEHVKRMKISVRIKQENCADNKSIFYIPMNPLCYNLSKHMLDFPYSEVSPLPLILHLSPAESRYEQMYLSRNTIRKNLSNM
jgi:hypothetical protein